MEVVSCLDVEWSADPGPIFDRHFWFVFVSALPSAELGRGLGNPNGPATHDHAYNTRILTGTTENYHDLDHLDSLLVHISTEPPVGSCCFHQQLRPPVSSRTDLLSTKPTLLNPVLIIVSARARLRINFDKFPILCRLRGPDQHESTTLRTHRHTSLSLPDCLAWL